MAGRVLSEEQSALSVELLASLAAAERGDVSASAEGGPQGRVREALRRERALEAQKAVLRAAAREDSRNAAAAAAAAAAPRELLPSVRLTLRSRGGDTRAVVVRRKEGVAALHALAVAKLRVSKKAVHALCAGVALLSLDAVADGAVVEFADEAPPAAAPVPERQAEQADDSASSSDDDDDEDADGLFGAGEPAQVPPARVPASLAAARAALPMSSHRAALLAALGAHPVVLLQAETGSGKSTQAPQFVLEAGGRVVVAQPRRVAAAALASRVAAERGERVGDVVGFAVRGESARSARTRLLYVTTGVLLRALSRRRRPGAPLLRDVTHIFLDEVHERSIAVDMCLLLLRRALSAGDEAAHAALPRICLMSATAEAAALAAYFGPSVGVMRVPGRSFPVRICFLEDVLEAAPGAPRPPPPQQQQPPRDAPLQQRRATDLPPDGGPAPVAPSERDAPRPARGYSAATEAAARAWDAVAAAGCDFALLAHAVTHAAQLTWQGEGRPVGIDDAILVFLPGAAEIAQAAAVLGAHAPLRAYCGGAAPVCAALHGSLPPREQAAAFAAPPPGRRKLVLATNVAETSLTIPDVAAVVDACRVRAPAHDASRGVTALREGPACRAALEQRAGRAGRVRAGIALRLITHAAFDALPQAAPPEMLTAPLENAMLWSLA